MVGPKLRLEHKLRGDVDRERVAAGMAPLYGSPGSIRRILLRAA